MIETKWEDGEPINKCLPNTVCKQRCQDTWDINYNDVLEWMETCPGCVMSQRIIWWKSPPNTICDLCQNDGITYEEAKKWQDGSDHGLYSYEIEEENQNVDLVLTNKGEKFINSFEGITFESNPGDEYAHLEFDERSEAINFLKQYPEYENGYKRLNQLCDMYGGGK